jgi:hypothetical protein
MLQVSETKAAALYDTGHVVKHKLQWTCGSGPLLHMAGYSSPQVGYKLIV